jgi:dolichol-phosphate mannosyltransferase
MARVSLIVPTIPSDGPPTDLIAESLRALTENAHDVDTLVVAESGASTAGWALPAGVRIIFSASPGRVAAALAGLERARGDFLLILDPLKGYESKDLSRLVGALERGEADLVVASRYAPDPNAPPVGQVRRLLNIAACSLTGTTDPLTGLIGMTRRVHDEDGHHFHPVGRVFSFEILAKMGGRWADVPVRVRSARKRSISRLALDDLRHLKHLADHRFGNLSRLIQFCAVGGSGMVVDLTCYFLFQLLFNRTSLIQFVVPPTKVTLADAFAGALAIGIALVWNFNLNRRLTFSYARGGSIFRQFLVYAASNGLGVALSLALRLLLPRKVPFFSHHKLFAAVVGIVMATGVSFSMSRWVVFRRHPSSSNRAPFSEPDADSDPAAVNESKFGAMPNDRGVLIEQAG